MKNFELLIEIAILIGILSLSFLFSKILESGWSLMDAIKSCIIYKKTKKQNKLHEPNNPFYKQINKVRLINGKKAFSFEEYETHFIDDKYYGD